MSALGDLAGGAVWKVAAIGLLAALPAIGGGWWLAAHDLRQAQAELAAERTRADDLAVGIREQNRAVEAMASAKTAADARGQAAQQLAAANGKRFDGALAQLSGRRATTCDDAMPAVNQLLESMK